MTYTISCGLCGVVRKSSRNAKLCRSCRRTVPVSLEKKAKTAESLKSYWSNRSFDQLSQVLKKRRVIEEQGHKCLHCDLGELWNNQPLVFQLDHINGDRKDNSRSNLRALCPNCHTQTPTFGSRTVSEDTRKRIIAGAKRGAESLHSKYTINGRQPASWRPN